MKTSHPFTALAFGTAFTVASSLVTAQSLTDNAPPLGQPAPIIAEILLDLEHFPSEDNKETLMAISQNEENSDAIRRIAEAVLNFEHSVAEEDVEALEEIAESDYATAREQTLADVVLNMEHMPSDEQVGRLAEVE